MFQIFSNLNVDWMGKRKPLIAISILVLIAGLASAIGRELTPGGTNAFNLGVDFQGGSVITVKFRDKPSEDKIREALKAQGVGEAVIQSSTDKTDEVLIKIPLIENAEGEGTTVANQVLGGPELVKKALNTLGGKWRRQFVLRMINLRRMRLSEPIQSVQWQVRSSATEL